MTTFRDAISPEELRGFNARSDWRAAWMVLFNWGLIALIFAGVATWTNPVTIVLGIFLLAGRQLGLAVLMHDCGHGTFFQSRKLNYWVGQWLCSFPVYSEINRYMRGHWQHHKHAGTRKDPDLGNYESYPVTRESFRRKVKRDLMGKTGWKVVRYLARSGRDGLTRAPGDGNHLLGHLITNGILFGILLATGNGMLYLLWPIAYVTVFYLYSRLRQAAEHAAVPNLFDLDPRMNTRTTIVRWWERLVVAPCFVNYHLEHHLAPAVPCYRLKALHERLALRGYYDGVDFPVGYLDLFGRVLLDDEPVQVTA